MKYRALGMMVWLVITGLAGTVMADSLSIRLVQAGNEGSGVGGGLGDVAQLLQDNLRFKSFQLVSSKSIGLPANGAAELGQGFTARCSGGANNLSVAIERSGKRVLSSTVQLQRGTPLIVGGFSSGNGKMIVILSLR
jgi:hypothetical protein